MKYYILSTTGFIRNKEKTLHCEQYTHITRSLFLLLYLFSKIVLVPRKRLRNQAGGHSTFLPCNCIITFILLICKLERQIICYNLRLSSSNKNCLMPIVTIPVSFLRSLILSLTIIIFLKESPIRARGRSSCACFSGVGKANADWR